MAEDRYQPDVFERIGDASQAENVTYDTAPSGIPLDSFWALVDPIDTADPRDA